MSLDARSNPNAGETATVAADTLQDKTSPDPAASLELEERKQQLRREIHSLPERQRVTLILSYYQQMSHAEVAEILNCSVGAVKTQLFRALKTLAGRLPDPTGGNV